MTEFEDTAASDSESDEESAAPGASLDDIDMDSDEELQEAFAAGLIKPGLNSVQEVIKKRPKINNVAGMKQKLEEFRQDKLPWIERLDMVNAPAPIAPELAYAEDQLKKKSAGANTAAASDSVHNDFKREMGFYRQAQAAVLEGLARLKSMNVPTKRPDDYFAQMAKTDEHMQKIRKVLVSKQMDEERLEKVRKLRDLRKYGKKVQAEVRLKREKDKKDMLDEVKKFRKGQTDTIDFLEDGGGKGKKPNKKDQNQASVQKRNFKDKKFGFGGKKRGLKSNTKDSVNDVTGFKPGFKNRGPDSGIVKRGKSTNAPGSKKNKRVGKARRRQARAGGGGGKRKS